MEGIRHWGAIRQGPGHHPGGRLAFLGGVMDPAKDQITGGKNPDGPGTMLRVWERAGVSGNVTVTLPGNFT